MDLLIATRNEHKLAEIRAILGAFDGHLTDLRDFPELPELPETSETFEGNALQKARFAYEHTGRIAVADDSGLEVDALGGKPGVHSKRFSPEATATANNALLLRMLGDRRDRTARFRCVIAVVGPGGEAVSDGRCEGQIGFHPHGNGGFGYDPLFLCDAAGGRALAELDMAEKNAISHRGRALERLPELLAAIGAR